MLDPALDHLRLRDRRRAHEAPGRSGRPTRSATAESILSKAIQAADQSALRVPRRASSVRPRLTARPFFEDEPEAEDLLEPQPRAEAPSPVNSSPSGSDDDRSRRAVER